MKVLIIGGGGREHAIAWKLRQSPRVDKVFVAPGNAGTALEPGIENVEITEIPELIEFAQKESIAITIVGPEAPLADGIVNAFQKVQLKIFGPTWQAAQLETSKIFAKEFMLRHKIPTARYVRFNDAVCAYRYIDEGSVPLVIKANGLASGKGVVVAETKEQAHSAVDAILVAKNLGKAGNEIIIEEFLQGTEVSFIVMTDGQHVLPPFVSSELHEKIMQEIIYPAIDGMRQEGIQYRGFLYAGLMITPNGQPKVLEFNCRLGDPETQPIMLRLKGDFFSIIEHAVNETLDQALIEWDLRTALGIVVAAHDFHIFHSGTAIRKKDNNEEIVTAGGRVLCVTSLGETIEIAQKNSYQLVNKIFFEGCQFRQDIGYQSIHRSS